MGGKSPMANTKDILMNNRLDEQLADIRITKIDWVRTTVRFFITIASSSLTEDTQFEYYFVNGAFLTNAHCKCEKISDRDYIVSVLITNPGYNMCMPEGIYSLYACVDQDVICRVQTTLEFAEKLADASKTFLHNGKSISYTINFSLLESDEGLFPLMHIIDAKKYELPHYAVRGDRDPDSSIAKAKRETKKLLKNAKKPKAIFREAYNALVAADLAKKKKKKTLLFMSEQNDVMGANLVAVYNRMKQRGIDEDFDILFSFRAIIGKKSEYGMKSWMETLGKIAAADIIFVDDHCPMFDWLVLHPKTTLIQLWHAGAGYKGVGYSRWGHDGCPAPFSCHRQYDWCITPSANIADFFSEQFGISDEQIIPTGMPRMDMYLDEDHRSATVEELYEKYPQAKGKKVILFAPTYRGKDRKTASYPYQLIDFEQLYELCGDEYVVIFKMHPWVSKGVPIEEKYSDKFFDAGASVNINDLFYITDLYISDYSSGVFEYSLMRKPSLFFAFDEMQFSYTRGFHRDYKTSVPGKVVHTFDELLEAIRNEDFEAEKIEPYINHHFDYIDTNSSDRVIDWFLLDQMPEEYTAKLKAHQEEMERLKQIDFISLKKPKH